MAASLGSPGYASASSAHTRHPSSYSASGGHGWLGLSLRGGRATVSGWRGGGRRAAGGGRGGGWARDCRPTARRPRRLAPDMYALVGRGDRGGAPGAAPAPTRAPPAPVRLALILLAAVHVPGLHGRVGGRRHGPQLLHRQRLRQARLLGAQRRHAGGLGCWGAQAAGQLGRARRRRVPTVGAAARACSRRSPRRMRQPASCLPAPLRSSLMPGTYRGRCRQWRQGTGSRGAVQGAAIRGWLREMCRGSRPAVGGQGRC